jgi:molybdate transport system substrate-binding protein
MQNRRPAMIFLLVVLALSRPTPASADEITIAAASDLNFAFKELVAGFEKQTGHRVKLSLGSSGNFFSQIQNGAPFDVYFSADIRYPQKLQEAGYAVPGSLYRYAIGRIVVWVPRTSSVDVEKLRMEALLEPSVRKIAIANPKHAPYGRAAVAAMEHFKLYERVKDRLVLGENISQAAQYVESGASDIGIIALSLALAPTMKAAGTYWEIPAEAHPPLEQGAVIVKGARSPEAAKAFLEFLRSSGGREVMTRYGFVVPE